MARTTFSLPDADLSRLRAAAEAGSVSQVAIVKAAIDAAEVAIAAGLSPVLFIRGLRPTLAPAPIQAPSAPQEAPQAPAPQEAPQEPPQAPPAPPELPPQPDPPTIAVTALDGAPWFALVDLLDELAVDEADLAAELADTIDINRPRHRFKLEPRLVDGVRYVDAHAAGIACRLSGRPESHAIRAWITDQT